MLLENNELLLVNTQNSKINTNNGQDPT